MTRSIDYKVTMEFCYSTEGYYLIQNETQIPYSTAIDVKPVRYTYSESNEKMPEEEFEEVLKKVKEIEEDNK